MISANRYPYQDEQCEQLHAIVCAAIRDSKVKFTPLSYAVFYQAAMNGFNGPLADELLALEKGKNLEYGLSQLYHKHIGESCLENIALLDEITEGIQDGSGKFLSVTQVSGNIIEQQVDRLDADHINQTELYSIAGKLKKEAMTLSVSNYQLQQSLSEAQTQLTDIKQKMSELQNMVTYDPLTGLHSRLAFEELLKKLLKNTSIESLGLIIADVDHFSDLNENYGFHVGDAVLRYISQKLKHTLETQAYIARFSGKSFAILFTNQSPSIVDGLVEKSRQALVYSKILLRATKQEIGNITASFGITYALPEDTEETLQQRALQAMHLSKQKGRNSITTL